jgi:hypothetical protein
VLSGLCSSRASEPPGVARRLPGGGLVGAVVGCRLQRDCCGSAVAPKDLHLDDVHRSAEMLNPSSCPHLDDRKTPAASGRWRGWLVPVGPGRIEQAPGPSTVAACAVPPVDRAGCFPLRSVPPLNAAPYPGAPPRNRGPCLALLRLSWAGSRWVPEPFRFECQPRRPVGAPMAGGLCACWLPAFPVTRAEALCTHCERSADALQVGA